MHKSEEQKIEQQKSQDNDLNSHVFVNELMSVPCTLFLYIYYYICNFFHASFASPRDVSEHCRFISQKLPRFLTG